MTLVALKDLSRARDRRIAQRGRFHYARNVRPRDGLEHRDVLSGKENANGPLRAVGFDQIYRPVTLDALDRTGRDGERHGDLFAAVLDGNQSLP